MVIQTDPLTQKVAKPGDLLDEIDQISHPFETAAELDPLMDMIGEARLVLLGEASHGTSEYYLWRARLSQRLIQEKGFSFICVEGDWPDCYRVNRYIKGYPDAGETAYEVLHAFERWPTWMWANWEVSALAELLRRYNQGRSNKVGFYGLDVYSLWESMESILGYLEQKDPQAAQLARQAYRCFEPYGEDVQAYAWSTRMVPETCEDEVIDLLLEMQRRANRYDGDLEAGFNAEQNSLVVVNAERYYRAMVRSDRSSWNIRDEHMMETLDRLMDFHGPNAKGIVWAHNTHVGDARYTDMARTGMFNIGQLARELHQEEGVVLVGFGSYQGTVIAGREWGAPMEVLPVPPGREGSWEELLHEAGGRDRLLLLPLARDSENLTRVRGHRAIGVVYNPGIESFGNYVPTVLPQRYDAFLYIDTTSALHPLHIEPVKTEPPDTYPWGV
ncbi:MAG: erythromycin esterase family protein [Chloroflexota bacterium]|nr:MAG: erythromycin esterase family protein [Chloroflexota bacterium]